MAEGSTGIRKHLRVTARLVLLLVALAVILGVVLIVIFFATIYIYGAYITATTGSSPRVTDFLTLKDNLLFSTVTTVIQNIIFVLIVALFLIELSLGLLSRMIPTMNIFVEGLPVKIFVSLTILSLALSFMTPALGTLFKGIDAEFLKVLRVLG